ncbi:MAG TPA: DoxX family membrane protein [Candidatus Paceibacterota bacterium]
MNTYQKFTLTLLRVSLGGLFFYAGITKVLDPSWSAAGYMNSAQNFKWLFTIFSSPTLLPITNFLNAWGLTLLGLSLILGIFVKYSAPFGTLLMFLYYLVLPFPMPNAHAFLIDEHIIYIFALITLATLNAGKIWGLDARMGHAVK